MNAKSSHSSVYSHSERRSGEIYLKVLLFSGSYSIAI